MNPQTSDRSDRELLDLTLASRPLRAFSPEAVAAAGDAAWTWRGMAEELTEVLRGALTDPADATMTPMRPEVCRVRGEAGRKAGDGHAVPSDA